MLACQYLVANDRLHTIGRGSRLLDKVRKLLDPLGPVGNWLSPSSVYKERAGLPIDAPTAIRAKAPTTTFDVQRALQPERVLPADAEVPKDRVRIVSAFIEEHFAPIYAAIDSTDLAVIFSTAPEIVGWRVTQHVRKDARAKAPMSAEQFYEHLQSLQIQASDAFYNQYLETVPGNDPVVIDGQVLRAKDGTVIRGGTQIRHGRKEYAQKTKGFVHWDKGFHAKREEALAEQASRPLRNVKDALEVTAGEKLPMHRPVGLNMRKDRARAV